MSKAVKFAAGLVVLASLASHARANNWSQWRGPSLNGSAVVTGLPDKLDPKDALWTLTMPGHGSNTPIIFEDKLFISSLDSQTQKLMGICVDNKTGKIIWKKELGDGFIQNQRNNLAAPSAITDGKTVFFYYGSGDLAALDMQGNILWQRNFQTEYGQFNYNWIYGSSPLLYEGKLYVQVLHRDVPARGGRRGGAGAEAPPLADSYLLAIDPATGKNIFRHVRPNNARAESKEAYSTPIPYEANGRKEILIVGADCVTAHDPNTGAELWRFGGWNPTSHQAWRVIPPVVIIDNKIVFCTPQGTSRTIAINTGGSGEIGTTHKAWENTQVKSDVPAPLVYDNDLFVLDGDYRKGLNRLDPKTGEVKWHTPITSSAVFRASPMASDGKVYLMNEAAEVWVLSAADGKVLSNTTLETQGTARGTIVAAQGRLFVRTGSTLYCFGTKP